MYKQGVFTKKSRRKGRSFLAKILELMYEIGQLAPIVDRFTGLAYGLGHVRIATAEDANFADLNPRR